MNKEEFLQKLRSRLHIIPQNDIDECISFYSEMIDDFMEDGKSECDAVAKIGSIDNIVFQMVDNIPITTLVKKKITPKRSLTALEIVLLVAGFPLWFLLLVTFGAIIISLYVVMWALIISLWVVEFSFGITAVSGIVLAFTYLLSGNFMSLIMALGIGFTLIGITIFMFYACIYSSKGILSFSKKALRNIKLKLTKEDAK